jgi:hypothetical protein
MVESNVHWVRRVLYMESVMVSKMVARPADCGIMR